MLIDESNKLQIDVIEDNTEKELNDAIDMSLVTLPLDVAEQNLVVKIIEAPTKEDLQTQLDLFNINLSKKNAMRVIKLNNLLDKVEDQVVERIEKRPDLISHRELTDYINVISNQIDRAQKSVDALKDSPPIRIVNQKNELNINVGPQLDRDSKERVMDVLAILLKQVQKKPPATDIDINKSENDVIDADIYNTGEKLEEEEN